MKKKKKGSGRVLLSVTVTAKLAARIDSILDEWRAQLPYQFLSRSALVSHALGEWIAILDDPHKTANSMVEIQRFVRGSDLKNSHFGVNGNARLTPKNVLAIRKDDRIFEKIARDMDVSISTISRIKNGSTWSWVR